MDKEKHEDSGNINLPSINFVDYDVAESELDLSAAATKETSSSVMCFGCKKSISDKYLLKSIDKLWHEDCLKCTCCDCRLADAGISLYEKSNMLLCKMDYLRLFGTTGSCYVCRKHISASEMVMKANTNVYHVDCFACTICYKRLCFGEKFHINDNKIICEQDFNERVIFTKVQPKFRVPVQYVMKRSTPFLNHNQINIAHWLRKGSGRD